jgi:surface protein
MDSMFYDCNKLTSLDLSNFDTSNVTYMSTMFYGCKNLTSLNVSNWNTSNVSTMYQMFYNCIKLTSLDVSHWDVGHIKTSLYIKSAFNNCKALVDLYPPQNINADMDFSSTTALSHDSLVRIINNLKTTASTKTLTLGATNLAKLTDDEKAIATGKGWTVR